MSTFNLDIKLPSKGLIYNPPLPEELIIRALTAKDEKVIFGSWSSKSLDMLLQRCIVEPKDFDVSKLISADKLAILIHLRMLTYGEDYSYQVKCPVCGKKQKVVINMQTDFGYYELGDQSCQPMRLTLPISQDTIDLYFLTQKELDDCERWIKKFLKNPNIEGDPSSLLRFAYMIKAVNGEEIPKEKCYGYLESLHAKDFAYIRSKSENFKLGFDFNVVKTCKFCGDEIEIFAGIGPEFFRPTFD